MRWATRREDERIRRLKGKAIVQDHSPATEREQRERGKLIIREPVSRDLQTREQGSDMPAQVGDMAGEKLVVRAATDGVKIGKDSETLPTGPGTIENIEDEDEELMNAEDFDKMVELYSDTRQMSDEEMLNVDEVDELLEEEQAMELERKTKEKVQEGEKKLPEQGESQLRESGIAELGKKATQSQQNQPIRAGTAEKTNMEGNVSTGGTQAAAARRKKGSRSPDVKGSAASKKMAVRGRSSPKSKASRQLRT